MMAWEICPQQMSEPSLAAGFRFSVLIADFARDLVHLLDQLVPADLDCGLIALA
jgi:hypothetical protein